MSVINAIVGATTDNGATIKAKISTSSADIVVSTQESLIDPVVFGPFTATTEGIITGIVTGLSPNTKYYYGIREGAVIDPFVQGSFRTHPTINEPADFTIAAASCAGLNPDYPDTTGGALAPNRVSNHPVFNKIENLDPLMFIHMGDLHYYDIGSGVHVPTADLATYRRGYDDVLLQSNQHSLYRRVSTAYMYDDHDWGPNDSNGTIPTRSSAIQAYRERWPHYPLGSSGPDNPNYQTWKIGRVQFILLDVRADRDPNTSPDGPTKSMLGSTQKEWIRDTISGSDAQLFCIISGSQWNGVGPDTWNSFPSERQELIDMFVELEVIDRMVMLNGDVHALAIDSGKNTGGFPLFVFASLDSDFGSPQGNIYDQGTSKPGRDQYGTLRFNDQGSFIEVTGIAYVDEGVWRSLVVRFDAEDPDDADSSPLPPVDQPAVLQNTVTWYAADVRTGNILMEIPEVQASEISVIVGTYTTAQLNIPIPTSMGTVWLSELLGATTPRRTMIVAVVNNVPVWGGMVLVRARGTDPVMRLSCATLEHYLDRRYVGDHSWVKRDQARIMSSLARDAEQLEGKYQGLNLLHDAPDSGILRDRTYEAIAHKTVLDTMKELMGVIDGPEFTIQIRWSDSTQTSFVKVLVVRNMLGLRSANPDAVFESQANSFETISRANASYTFKEDHSARMGANVVLAYSSGEGDSRPISTVMKNTQLLDSGEPVFEYHYQPSNNITEQSTLDSHALNTLARMGTGSVTFDIEARWDAYPRLGYEWNLGDDVSWSLVGHGHPEGVVGHGRVMGWTLSPSDGLIRPILWEGDNGE